MLNKDLSVAILVGGQSSRFGSRKALARLGGKQLIEYALELASKLTNIFFFVTTADFLFKQLDVDFYTDIIEDCGPIGAVYTALKAARTSLVATIPCDMPLLTSDVYESLLEQLSASSKPIVAVSDKGMEPLVTVWPQHLYLQIHRAIKAGKFELHDLLKSLKAREVYLPQNLKNYDPMIFANINYQQDLKLVSQYLKTKNNNAT